MPPIHYFGPRAPDDAFPPPWRSTPAADGDFASIDEALLFEPWCDWGEADLALNERVEALRQHKWELRVPAARVCVDWFVASLQDVRDRLRDMRAAVTNARARHRIRRDSLLVQYMAETYVWAGDVLTDVMALVEEVNGSPVPARRRSTEESSAYIEDFLTPLHMQIGACRFEVGLDPELNQALAHADRLHEAVVVLDWGLRTEGSLALRCA